MTETSDSTARLAGIRAGLRVAKARGHENPILDDMEHLLAELDAAKAEIERLQVVISGDDSLRAGKIKASLEIHTYMHCVKCLDERPNDVSPRDWARLEAGWTRQGLQLWCTHHECNVVHIDFEGHQHPSNADCLVEPPLKLVGD